MFGGDEYMWRVVYDDGASTSTCGAYVRKLARMAKANDGFGNVRRYQ